MALINGIELYTKKAIADHYPGLSTFLYREPIQEAAQLNPLNQYRDTILDTLKGVQTSSKGSLALFYSKPNKNDHKQWNFLKYQCRGTIIDVQRERLVCLPLTWPLEHVPSWPVDKRDTPADTVISVCKLENHVFYYADHSFETAVSKRVKKQLDTAGLDLNNHWYFFTLTENEIVPLGSRHKVTLVLK